MTALRSFLGGLADGLRTVWPAMLVVPAMLVAVSLAAGFELSKRLSA